MCWDPESTDILQNMFAFDFVLLLLEFVVGQSDVEHLTDACCIVDVQSFELLGCEVLFEVLPVFSRKNYIVDPCALRGQNLLFNSANWKHVSAEGNLASHRQQRTHLLSCQERRERSCHGHASRGAVLRNRS